MIAVDRPTFAKQGGIESPTRFFLFTDIVKSSQLWEKFPDEFPSLLNQHNHILEEIGSAHGGTILKNIGDGYIFAFERPEDAVVTAVEMQRALQELPPLPGEEPIAVRAVIHGGPVHQLSSGRGYFGPVLNRSSRLCQVCYGDQILLSSATKSSLAGLPKDYELIDLGLHYLRDLSEPEQIFQVSHPALKAQRFPPLPTLGQKPNNLPPQPNLFVGREKEMKELTALFRDPRNRLITLIASGGMGKTRLALQLCAHLCNEFTHGAYHVPLDPLVDVSRFVTYVAAQLGFRFYKAADPDQQLLDYLHEKEMLLFLDNFEHVLGASDYLKRIWENAPRVKIIVSSREPLRLTPERRYHLGALETVAASDVPLDEIESVQLFVDRALRVRKGLSLDEKSLQIIHDIVQRVEGNPLAIELISSWADVFSLQEMLTQLDHQLDIVSGYADVRARHRSLRASFDWSFNLMSLEDRIALVKLSVFRGGFSLTAARDVLELGDPLAMTARLIEKSWLYKRETVAMTRYQIREAAARDYCMDRLNETELLRSTARRHSEYFAKLIEWEGKRIEGEGQVEALEILESEYENILAGLDTALQESDESLLLPFTRYLQQYLEMVSRWQDGSEVYGRISQGVYSPSDQRVKLFSILGMARMSCRLGEYGRSAELASKARSLGEELGDSYCVAQGAHLSGMVSSLQGHFNEAQKLLGESLSIYRRIRERSGIALVLNHLGIVADHQGRYEEAEERYRESVAISRELGDSFGISRSLNNLALIAIEKEEYGEARDQLEEALTISRALGSRYTVSRNLFNLGTIAMELESYGAAEELYKQTLEISREIGDRAGVSLALNNLGRAAFLQQRLGEARCLYDESLAIRMDIGDRRGTSSGLSNLGVVLMHLGNYEEAEGYLKKSLAICREIGTPDGIRDNLGNLANLTLRLNRLVEACQYVEELISLTSDANDLHGLMVGVIYCGSLLVEHSMLETAALLLETTLRIARGEGQRFEPQEEEESRRKLAELERELGREKMTDFRDAAHGITAQDLAKLALDSLRSLPRGNDHLRLPEKTGSH